MKLLFSSFVCLIMSASAWGQVMEGQLVVAPTSIDYGIVEIPSIGKNTAVAETVTLTNSGDAILEVTDMVLSDNVNYAVDLEGGNTPCLIKTPTLDLDESCTMDVVFAPVTAGEKDGALTIATSSDTTPEAKIFLSGAGIAFGEACSLTPHRTGSANVAWFLAGSVGMLVVLRRIMMRRSL